MQVGELFGREAFAFLANEGGDGPGGGRGDGWMTMLLLRCWEC